MANSDSTSTGVETGLTIPRPVAGPDSVAYVVRGHTMGAIRDGWLVFVDRRQRPPRPAVHGALCVVRTLDGAVLLRTVQPARRKGRYDLLSVTGEPKLDVELRWAEPVEMIVPFDPPAELSEKLLEVG